MCTENVNIMPRTKNWVSNGQELATNGADELMIEPCRFILSRKVFPCERQVQVGTRVPPSTNAPGVFRLSFKSLLSGLRIVSSAF